LEDIKIPEEIRTLFIGCGKEFCNSFFNDSLISLKHNIIVKRKSTLLMPFAKGIPNGEEHVYFYSKENQERHLIQKSFSEFLASFEKEDYGRSVIFPGTLPEDEKDLHIGRFQEDAKKIEDKVFVWGINNVDSNDNGESAVISFKLKDSLSIVCTGDATKETFNSIQKQGKNLDAKIKENYLGKEVMIVLPHHGSSENKSDAMLYFFDPKLFFLSSGLNEKYRHPDLTYMAELSERAVSEKFPTSGQEKTSNYVLVYKNEKKELSLKLKKYKNIISTNVSDYVKFEKNVFSRSFNDTIVYDGNKYRIKLSEKLKRNQLDRIDSDDEDKNPPVYAYYTKSEKDHKKLCYKIGNKFYPLSDSKKVDDKEGETMSKKVKTE